jgi:hypothetical protein
MWGIAVLTENRARKPPVIHPGDEAPFLVWGEGWSAGQPVSAVLSCLTEAGKPGMIGIDVLVQEKA